MIYAFVFLTSLVLSLVLTGIIRKLAQRYQVIAAIRDDRWSKRRVPLLGGVAIYLVFTICFLLFLPKRSELWWFFVSSSFVFLLGLWDDFKHIQPQTKIVGQILAACLVIFFGEPFGFFKYSFIGIPVVILWLVFITNSFNILDNMDGLACGIGAISASILFLSALLLQNYSVALICSILAGAALGFLPYNFNPAKIFMGDAGSMFLGFSLASLVISKNWKQTGNLFVVLAVPVLVLIIPLFDSIFVIVMRNLSGRSIFQGGKDHSSHSLVALGLSEKKSVLFLYGIALFFGVVSLIGLYFNIYVSTMMTILVLMVILFFGIFLGQKHIYHKDYEKGRKGIKNGGIFIFNTVILNKRNIAEALFDLGLISFSYFAAYLIQFEGIVSDENFELIAKSLPVIIMVKFCLFFLFGIYRGIWRYASVTDFVAVFKAVFLSSIFSCFALFLLTGAEQYLPSLFVIDALLLLFLIVGSRTLLRIFKEYLFSLSEKGKKVLIVGASDSGELLLRFLKNRDDLNYLPVGFIDNDSRKTGKRIHGVPILGVYKDLQKILSKKKIDEVLISSPEANSEDLKRIFDVCRDYDISCKQTEDPVLR